MRHWNPTTLKSLAENLAGAACMLGLAVYVLGSAQAQAATVVAPYSNFISPSKTVPLVPGQMLAGSDFVMLIQQVVYF